MTPTYLTPAGRRLRTQARHCLQDRRRARNTLMTRNDLHAVHGVIFEFPFLTGDEAWNLPGSGDHPWGEPCFRNPLQGAMMVTLLSLGYQSLDIDPHLNYKMLKDAHSGREHSGGREMMNYMHEAALKF